MPRLLPRLFALLLPLMLFAFGFEIIRCLQRREGRASCCLLIFGSLSPFKQVSRLFVFVSARLYHFICSSLHN